MRDLFNWLILLAISEVSESCLTVNGHHPSSDFSRKPKTQYHANGDTAITFDVVGIMPLRTSPCTLLCNKEHYLRQNYNVRGYLKRQSMMTKTTTEQSVQDGIDEASDAPKREYSSFASKMSQKKSTNEPPFRRDSFLLAKDKMPEEMLDSGSDSDPEKPVLRQIAKDHQQAPSKEQDRESLLRELGQFSFTTLEEYKAANAERLKRCYMADERDQNRNILHWLSVHLPSNPTDDENTSLHWLVTTVVELEPKIVTMVATDSQKANCLQTAIEHARFDLIESLFKTSDDEALRVAISQGNHCNETCLHLAVRLGPPGVGLTLQLLENAHPKAILKQRKYRFEDDKPNHGNTVLHDFVHINVCFVKGYMKTLRRFIQLCPEALMVSNAAKESPFQFHIATRNKVYPDWQGLEFSPRTERHDKKKEAAAKVGRLLLDEAFSQSTWEDACGCVYGESEFSFTF